MRQHNIYGNAAYNYIGEHSGVKYASGGQGWIVDLFTVFFKMGLL